MVGTSINEVYQLTLQQLHSAPNELNTEAHDGLLERETVKVYNNVTYGHSGLGSRKLPAIQLLVQAHAPRAAGPPLAASSTNETALGHGGFGHLRALAVHPSDERKFVTCGADGVLRMWDAQHGRVHFMYRLAEGEQTGAADELACPPLVQSLCFSPDCDDAYHLAIGCCGKILVIASHRPMVFGDDLEPMTLGKQDGIGPREVVTCLKYTATASAEKSCQLAAGLSSGAIVLYSAKITDDMSGYEKLCKFKGHSGAVVHMDFSKQDGGDAQNLQSNCTRFELRFWNLKSCKEHKAASQLRDELWETLTCSLSWPSLGVGADDFDVVPSVDRSPDNANMVGSIWPEAGGPVLALSGLRGQVMLARYPCQPRADMKGWHAHAAPAAAIRFTHGGQGVVSLGEDDVSVCYWRRQLPVHAATRRLLELPRSMKAGAGEAEAEFLAKESGSHAPAAGAQLGAQAAFDDAKAFLTTTKQLKAVGWDAFHPDDLLAASRLELAKYDLKLQHVHGARGHRALTHVLYNRKGQALYPAASVVVVQEGDQQVHSFHGRLCRPHALAHIHVHVHVHVHVHMHMHARLQVHHFQGHSDDVLCLDVSDDGTLAATGQVAASGANYICIWDAERGTEEVRIPVNRDGGVFALAFKPAGGGAPPFLASIANDEDSSIDVWDLRGLVGGARHVPLLTSTAGDKHRVLSVAWNPFHKRDDFGSFVTCGDKHLHFWTFAQDAPADDAAQEPGRVLLRRHIPLWYDATQRAALMSNMHTRVYIHTYMHACIHTCIHTCTCTSHVQVRYDQADGPQCCLHRSYPG